MQEIWKDIYFIDNGIVYDYKGLYQVSNMGRVKSLKYHKTNNEKILKFIKSKKGYLRVCLCKNQKTKKFLVHRLVAYMFIPNPDNLLQVNHKNEIRNCNEYWNLEWCDAKYNIQYSQSKRVNQYDLKGNLIKTWPCINEVGKILNIRYQNIWQCCQQKRKTAGGYIWKYIE